jgi:plastocyanin
VTGGLRRAAVAAAVALATTAGGYGAVALAAAGGHGGEGGLVATAGAATAGPASGRPGGGAGPGVVGPGAATVEVGIEHSRFVLAPLRVVEGTEVRFVLANGDPIGHELIVGDAAVHERHERGHEAWHPPRAGEVSVAPNAEASTTYVFDRAGTVAYACHLPGHVAFGMHGTIEVVPA